MQNPKFGADLDTEYQDAENQNLPILVDVQPSQKLPQQMTTNQIRTKPNDTLYTEDPVTLTQNFASKKSPFGTEDVKQEPQDSPSMSNILQSQTCQSSTTGVKDDMSLAGLNAASKESFGSEVNI